MHVTREFLQQTDKHIHPPDDIFSYCVENIKGIQFIYVPSKDIKDEEVKLAYRYAFLHQC
jgi:hypothetical protein